MPLRCVVVLVHRSIDVLALAHFGRTARALGGSCIPNDVCSFPSFFLHPDFTSLFLSLHMPETITQFTTSSIFSWAYRLADRQSLLQTSLEVVHLCRLKRDHVQPGFRSLLTIFRWYSLSYEDRCGCDFQMLQMLRSARHGMSQENTNALALVEGSPHPRFM